MRPAVAADNYTYAETNYANPHAPTAFFNGSATTTYYVHPDHLGSTNVVTDENGDVVEALDYYPYGEERIHTGDADADRTFIGQFGNDPTSLSYLNARYYDPARGQFVSEDPVFWSGKQDLTNPQSLNSYSYANGNPITSSDPNGLSAKTALQGALDQLGSTLRALNTLLTNRAATYARAGQVGTSNIMHPIQTLNSAKSSVSSYLSDTRSALKTIGSSDEGDYILGQRAVDLGLMFVGGAGWETAAVSKTPQVLINKAAGDAFRDSVAAAMEKAGYEVQTEVFKGTFFGGRSIDVQVSRGGQILGGIEAKTGNSRYTPMQRTKDAYLKIMQGYIVNVIRRP